MKITTKGLNTNSNKNFIQTLLPQHLEHLSPSITHFLSHQNSDSNSTP